MVAHQIIGNHFFQLGRYQKRLEYYLHLFTEHQPDLNWENPEVRENIYNVMKYWLDMGVDGFRIDVVTLLSKDQNFEDIDENLGFRKVIENYYANGPKIHSYLNEMYDKVMKGHDAFTMGEGVGVTSENAPLYVDSNRHELDMIYHFDILENNIVDGKYDEVTKFDLVNLKSIIRKWQSVIDNNGWIVNAFGNHDFARMVSRFGDDSQYHKESAKMLITLLATQNGTLNIYQGDEIGMTNTQASSIEQIDDIQARNFYQENTINKKFNDEVALEMINNEGRDNARTPMQWSDDEYAGFSINEPWLAVNKNYTSINVENQMNDSDSILSYYRELLNIRKNHQVFYQAETVELNKDNQSIYAYEKKNDDERVLVFLSFSSTMKYLNIILKQEYNYQIMINNYDSVFKDQEKIQT